MNENGALGLQAIFENLLNYLNTDGEVLSILLSNRGSLEIQFQIKDYFRNNAKKKCFSKI
ncbi:hypothetical protein [Lentilactobacillus kosonis]|uniref:Uncharacterized protein n=1 Tax=Lentilactobacillus kosonis TaxID=2810561 RepID=A0A401FHY2_9LACO|nr:hypothetical protein [Lentilactobacillus kosonis]GAY71969.1 hypothetical protein NBRC111893_115 [Lentilactobacillus kosonis]